MNKLEKIKEECDRNSIDLSRMVWISYLTVELGKSYKPTIDQLDDLYSVLVGGVLSNLGRGKIPEYMEGIGPKEEERNTLDSWRKLRNTLIYDFGGLCYPYEKWIKENPESEGWVDLIGLSMEMEEEFERDPNKWAVDLRKMCKPYYAK